MTTHSTSNRLANQTGPTQTKGEPMTTEQREQLREVLIDYLQVLTSDTEKYPVYPARRIAEVRLLLREVA
jgi:replicative DNA helicase